MGHDLLFISKRLKSHKQALENSDQEVFYEMAIDMEFPSTENNNETNEMKEESC